MMTRVRTTYLELRSLADFIPSTIVATELVTIRTVAPNPELSRSLYDGVGKDYYWIDRLSWTDEMWLEWLSRPDVETWVARHAGRPAGYFELEAQGASVEIVYFGLLPAFTGQGLGGYLLTEAVHRAYAMRAGVERVWLHTCTLDHPAALAGYLARGFVVFDEVDEDMDLPRGTPGQQPEPARPG